MSQLPVIRKKEAALGEAIHEVNAAVDEMRKEHDALASLIFAARRDYQTLSDNKSGKRVHPTRPRPGSGRATRPGNNNRHSWITGAYNNEFELTADPDPYAYWIEIRIVRTSPDALVTVYSTTLKDVL